MRDLISALPQNLRTRFAPTPSGYLHLGNAVSFVITWLLAQAVGGKVSLRIDDLDAARMRSEYLEDIFETLDWLQLTYDEGPSSPTNFLSEHSQTKRVEAYLKNVALLQQDGDTFYCDCSRKTIKTQSTDGQYPMTCRNKRLENLQKPKALRIKTPRNKTVAVADIKEPKQFHLFHQMRDFVLVRKEGIPAYQIASLTDDIEQSINFIVRGEDLWLSSAAQIFLAEKLNQHHFSEALFFHHPIIKNAKGKKLSKSAGDISIQYLRENGAKPGSVYKKVGAMFRLNLKASNSLATLLEEIGSL